MGVFWGVLFVGLLAYILFMWLLSTLGGVATFLMLTAVAVSLLVWAGRREERFQAGLGAAHQKIHQIADRHREVLLRKRAELIQVDDYGLTDRSAWEQELHYFTERAVIPRMAVEDFNFVTIDQIAALVDAHLDDGSGRGQADVARISTTA